VAGEEIEEGAGEVEEEGVELEGEEAGGEEGGVAEEAEEEV